jgi:hypothetical protein
MMSLITYPRTGSHYLRELLSQKLDIHMSASHLKDEASGFVFTIARDPYDTLQSFLTMSAHYDQEVGTQAEIEKCSNLYRYLHSRANVVIDYETLVKNPDKVVQAISGVIGKPVIDHPYKDTIVDKPHKGHLVSSTTSSLYNKNHLDGHDLHDVYSAYYLLLSRRLV